MEYDPILLYVEDTEKRKEFTDDLERRRRDLARVSRANAVSAYGDPFVVGTLGEELPPPPPGAAPQASPQRPRSMRPVTAQSLGEAVLFQGGDEERPNVTYMSGKKIGAVKEDKFLDVVRKSFEGLPPLAQQAMGGAIQSLADMGVAGFVDMLASRMPGPEGEVEPAAGKGFVEEFDDRSRAATRGGTELFEQGKEEYEKTLPNVVPGSLNATVYGAVQSIGLSGTALLASVATGNVGPLMALATLSGAQEYGEQKAHGTDDVTALVGAIGNGLAEFYGERLPFEAYMNAPGFFAKAIQGALFDTVGELGTQTVQSAIQKLTYEPGMTWTDFVETLRQTGAQSLLAAGAQGVTIGGAAQLAARTDMGPQDFKGYVEQQFPGAQVELHTTGGARVSLPNGRRVEIYSDQSWEGPDLYLAALAKGDKKEVESIRKGERALAGVYFPGGQLDFTENDVIYLSGSADLTTLPHEKGHLVVSALNALLSPEELSSIGLSPAGWSPSAEEGVMTAFEEYAYKRTPSAEQPKSLLDKAFDKVIDFAHEVYSSFSGKSTQRQTFEKMRSGEVFTREGAQRLPGESDVDFQTRTRVPRWHEPVSKTRSGRIIGAPFSHSTPQAREGLVRKSLRWATEMFKVNPDQAMWYEKIGETIRRLAGLRQDEQGNWTGNIELADQLMRGIALWSPKMPVQRNAESVVEVLHRMARGMDAGVPGAVASAETMAARFPEVLKSEEVTGDEPGLGPKATSFYWDIHNATYGIADPKNATIDTHIAQLWGLAPESGGEWKPGATGYGWARDVMEEVTRRFNEQHGTEFSPRHVQALLWEFNRQGRVAVKSDIEHMGKYIGVGVVAGEAIPSTSSDVAPWIHEADARTKQAASDYVVNAVLFDDMGRNIILQRLGVPAGADLPGRGSWEGALNPNVSSTFLLPVGMDPRLSNLYADIWGYVFSQDSVLREAPNAEMTGDLSFTHGVLIETEGAEIPAAAIPSFVESLKKKVNTEITYDGRSIRAINLRDSETGLPYSGIDDTRYYDAISEVTDAWAKKHGIKTSTVQYGTDASLRESGRDDAGRWSGRQYQEGIRAEGSPDLLQWADDLRQAAHEAWAEFTPTEEVELAGAKFQFARPKITDDTGKDLTSRVMAAAIQSGRPVRFLSPEDRMWLLPNGYGVFLPEWALHEAHANEIAGRAGAFKWVDNATFGGALGAIRVHGLQKSYRWAEGNELAFEIFGPPSKKQMEIIRASLPRRTALIADITNPETGDVITYAQGQGLDGFEAFQKAVRRSYSGKTLTVKLQAKTVSTPVGEFPVEHKGWQYDGPWPGSPYYQYTNYDPESPAYKAGLMVQKPEELDAAIDRKLKQFEEGKEPKLQTKEFQSWFSGSKIVDAEGKPLVVYHGSDSDKTFDRFRLRPGDIGIHFGTEGQANDRLSYRAELGFRGGASRIYPVYLRITNPFRMNDVGSWNYDNMIHTIKEAFPNDWRVNNLHTTQDIRRFLRSRGYDGIVYSNTGETGGAAPYDKAQRDALKVLVESQKRRGKSYNSFDAEDRETPEYKAFDEAYRRQAEYRANNAQDSWIAFDRKQIKSVFNESPRFSDPRFQSRPRTPGPRKGLTVNFSRPEVSEIGEDLLRRTWEQISRVQTNDETLRRAQGMISSGEMTLEAFVQHNPNEAWPTTAHQVAAEMLAGGVFDYVQRQVAEAREGRITQEEGLQALLIGMQAVGSWYGPQSEVGRMLQARQMVVTPEGIPASEFLSEQFAFAKQMQEAIDKGLIEGEEILEAASKFYSMEQLQSFAKRAAKAKDLSILNQLFYFSLLSNPVTQAANFIGNVGPLFFAIAEQYISEKMPFGATPRGGTAGMIAGLTFSIFDAFALAKRAGFTGETSFGDEKFRSGAKSNVPSVQNAREELDRIRSDKAHPYNDRKSPDHKAAVRDVMRLHRQAWNPISAERISRLTSGNMDAEGPMARFFDVLGEIVDAPFKGLAAGDEFFKALNYRMFLWGRAFEMAAQRGLEGKGFNEFVARFVNDPPETVDVLATEFAMRQTFTNEVGRIGQAVQDLTNEFPAARLIVPFVRVISNIARYNLERTPLAPMLRQVRADIRAGGKARDMALSKIAFGSAVMASFSVLAAAGIITGGGPSDPKLKKIWQQSGWQEYSVRVGGKYYSYKRIEPFATPIGVAADLIEMARFAPDFGLDEAAVVGVLSFIRNFVSKTYMQGVANFLDAITSGGDDTIAGSAARYAREFPRLLVPGAVAQVSRVADPIRRDTQSWIDAIKSRIPGLSSSLEPMRNLKGDVINVEMYESIPGKGFGMINPIYWSSDSKDVVWREIMGNRVPVTMPSRRIGGGGNPDAPQLEESETAVMLTPEQYGWLVRMAGNDLKDPGTGRGAWDTLTAIINGVEPVMTRNGEPVYYAQKNPDGTPVFSDGPEGGKAAIIKKVLGDYRAKARELLISGEAYPDVRNQYVGKRQRRLMKKAPRVTPRVGGVAR